jgi:hypothetical protein
MPTAEIAAPARPRVFISHSEADRDSAAELREALAQNGVAVELPSADLRPGESVAARIGSALGNADAVLFLISPSALRSEWFNREIALATAGYPTGKPKRLIPVILSAAGELPPFLRDLQYVDASRGGAITRAVPEILAGLASGAPRNQDVVAQLEMRGRMIEAEYAMLRAQEARLMAEYARRNRRLALAVAITAAIATTLSGVAVTARFISSPTLVSFVLGAAASLTGALGVLYVRRRKAP